MNLTRPFLRAAGAAALLACSLALPLLAAQQSHPPKDAPKDKKSVPETTNLTIRVVDLSSGRPVPNASVYLRFQERKALLFLLHKHQKVELDLKTDNHGYTSFPEVPQGRLLIQVFKPEWQTFGEYYQLNLPKQTILIKLHRPQTHWF